MFPFFVRLFALPAVFFAFRCMHAAYDHTVATVPYQADMASSGPTLSSSRMPAGSSIAAATTDERFVSVLVPPFSIVHMTRSRVTLRRSTLGCVVQ